MAAIAHRSPWPAVSIGRFPGPRALLAHLAMRARQRFCGLTGHERLRECEADVVRLRCIRCGDATPGWQIDVDPKYRLPRARLVAVRRRPMPEHADISAEAPGRRPPALAA
jgi:hypothetical protein